MGEARTLPEALERAASGEAGFHIADEDGAERFWSYADLLDRALAVAGALTERGLARGERVAIIVAEPAGFLPVFLGAVAGGFVPVPIYPPASAGQLEPYLEQTRHIVRAAEAAAIVAAAEIRPLLGTVLAGSPATRFVASAGELDGPAAPGLAPVSPADPALVQFTSGSTTRPRGVVLTHANLAANALAIGAGLRVDRSDLGVSWLPLYHDMGLIGMAIASIYHRVTTAILPPLLFLKRPVQWLRALTRHRGTISFAPSFAYGLCTKRIREEELAGLDLSTWRVAGCGAEPIQPDTLAAFAARFAAVGFRDTAFLPSYGLAEHTLAVTFPAGPRRLAIDVVDPVVLAEAGRAEPCAAGARFVGCGRPSAGHELVIVHRDGRRLGEREVGEIVVAGPSVMAGYAGRADLTAEVLRGGALHTGDLGYLAEGELYVCGRAKDVIIRRGRNYYPHDIEWAVGELPGVRKGSVVAFGQGAFGAGEALVVVVEAQGAADDRLAEAVRRQVLAVCGIEVDEVVAVPAGAIPKTSSGKLRRARTAELYRSGALAAPTPATRRKLLRLVAASQAAYAVARLTRLLRLSRRARPRRTPPPGSI